jgi:hypothetical protein
MEPEPNPNENPKPRHPKANKRSPAQRAADLLFLERHHLRGATLDKLVRLVAAERSYTLSRAQIANDLTKLKNMWLREAKDTVAHEREKQLRKLDKLEEELWEAWDRSQRDELVRTMGKTTAGGTGEEAGQDRKSDNVRKVTRDGDASFTRQILDVQDRRAKLLGLDAPTKTELTGKDGAAIVTENTNLSVTGLDDAEQDAVLQRFLERRIAEGEPT